MLNKRTNILFDSDLWAKMSTLAKTQNISIGELVRQAVAAQYTLNFESDRIQKICQEIEAARPQIKGKIDYKALINHGRKR